MLEIQGWILFKKDMRNKWLKALIVAATVVPWSVVIVLLLQVKSIVSQQPKVETVPVIEVADTIINEQPKFFSQTPKEGLEEALSYYGLEHKDIVYAQAVLETGHFKSKVCLNYNNLFALLVLIFLVQLPGVVCPFHAGID